MRRDHTHMTCRRGVRFKSDSFSFLRTHFSLRHRIVTPISRLLDNHTYVTRHGLAKGLKRKGGVGFLPEWLVGSFASSAEIRFLSRLDLRHRVVYDIGAFDGVSTLFFAQQAAHVVAYEPNPLSFRRLLENIELNAMTNVTLRGVGVGAGEGFAEIVFDSRMMGGATADHRLAGQLRRSSRRLYRCHARFVRVDDDVEQNRLPAPDLISLDVEGMELDALKGMPRVLAENRPALYIELHGTTMEQKEAKVQGLVGFLVQAGYTDITHVESGTGVHAGSSTPIREGHLYCTARPVNGHEDGH